MVLLQRAMVNRLRQPAFCQRPDKPWEGTDDFSKASDAHIDLMEMFGGWGKGTPSLHEFATACGVPGKLLADGHSVVDLWLAGDVRRIVQYNECDALSTYLLWLAGRASRRYFTVDEHAREEERVQCLLVQRGVQSEPRRCAALRQRGRRVIQRVRRTVRWPWCRAAPWALGLWTASL